MVGPLDHYDFSIGDGKSVFYRPSLSEQISKKILELIRENQLKPGDRLPPERKLAETLSVSRTSLREALRALSMMRILEIRQGDGTYITSLEPELLVENLEVIFSLNPTTVIEVFEFEMLFEPMVARLAAKKASKDDVDFLEKTFKKVINNKENLDKFLDHLIAIRIRLHEISGNSLVIQMDKVISNILDISSKKHGAIVGVSEKALKKLESSIHAIRNRNEEMAFTFMKERYEILYDEFIASSYKVTG